MAERKIAGREFKVNPPLATEALRLQARLTKLLQAADTSLEDIFVINFVADAGKPEQKAKAAAAAISTIGRIFSTMSPDEYASLVTDVIGMAQIKRPSGAYEIADLDGDFSTDLKSIPQVFLFVLEVVYRDFFLGLAGIGTRLNKAMA